MLTQIILSSYLNSYIFCTEQKQYFSTLSHRVDLYYTDLQHATCHVMFIVPVAVNSTATKIPMAQKEHSTQTFSLKERSVKVLTGHLKLQTL